MDSHNSDYVSAAQVPRHTIASLAIAIPRATVRAALLAGELTPEGLTLYQPHAPLWALSLRIEMALVWLRDFAA